MLCRAQIPGGNHDEFRLRTRGGRGRVGRVPEIARQAHQISRRRGVGAPVRPLQGHLALAHDVDLVPEWLAGLEQRLAGREPPVRGVREKRLQRGGRYVLESRCPSDQAGVRSATHGALGVGSRKGFFYPSAG